MDKINWRKYQYYLIIIVASAVSIFVLPMLGSEVGLEWRLPNSAAGWAVYIVSKLAICILNVLIFDAFIRQARVNVEDNPRYIRAREILDNVEKASSRPPRGPRSYFKALYASKGVSIAMTSLLSIIGLSQAVLTLDIPSLISYAITIGAGVIFGSIQMRVVEDYWTNEYLDYANYKSKKEGKS